MQESRPHVRGLDESAPAQAGYAIVSRRSRPPAPAAPPAAEGRPGVALSQGPDLAAAESEAEAGGWQPEDEMPSDPLEDLGSAPPTETPAPRALAPDFVLPPGAPRNPRRAAPAARAPEEELLPLPGTPMPGPVETSGRADRDVHVEPSIIIDMGSLGDTPPPTPPPASPPRDDRLAASPGRRLASGSRLPGGPAELDAEDDDIIDLPRVPRRSFGRFLGLTLLLAVGGALFVVWAKNDFGNVLERPRHALDVAIGRAPLSAPPTQPAAIVISAPPASGELRIEDVRLEPLPRQARALLLQGRLTNTTTTTQRAIALRAVVKRAELPVRERTVACCEVFDSASAQAIAHRPDHPHFSTRLNHLGDVALAPGESRPFSVVFPTDSESESDARSLTPVVEVKHSETERAP